MRGERNDNYIAFSTENQKHKYFFFLEDREDFRKLQWVIRSWKQHKIEFGYMYRGNKVDILFEP
jgi:hypothetical protein